ncbi:TetR/AcrR family transcriptional regulator [Paracoccus fistulariae]|uniref:TetR/AcrR family transcriptional regulator n=1 Tax=Paracoccus fistulariae TaxID=658446 RepID=A0ABY7SQM0_9RHOB|nr:TetR/AcrR family transcriptional regulator [Paracoccus fistulariae]MDB6183155.1 TetR/AcrR family transcriptional regulator [Paracoccus fistulariae]WCR09146.1 TetR/AcrR family transcriptional regulator [Paracoccus fistulariae]
MSRSATRERIEEKADALFYEAGFEATSFADIASAIGISRGNFYHHFKSKDEILEAVITRRLSATQAMLEAWDTDAAPKDRILSFIRILITNRTKIMAFGCPVGTLTTELAKLDHIAEARAAQIFTLFRDWLADQFRALGHRDDADALALHVLARSQGIAVMASALKDEAFLRAEVAALEAWLDQLPDHTPTKG